MCAPDQRRDTFPPELASRSVPPLASDNLIGRGRSLVNDDRLEQTVGLKRGGELRDVLIYEDSPWLLRVRFDRAQRQLSEGAG